MNQFDYRDGQMYAESVPLRDIAQEVGTPFFCYSSEALVQNYTSFAEAVNGFDAEICYAVKASSNLAVISLLAELGAGADVVSGGELRRALTAGIIPKKIVFSGVGKTREELSEALKAGVTKITVESDPELDILSEVAVALGINAEISIRINPDVDARTHEKISTGKKEDKFGIDLALAREIYARAAGLPGINVIGVAVHIGSQLTDLQPYKEAYARVVDFVSLLRADGIPIEHVDLGGGLGISYKDELAISPNTYAQMVAEVIGNLDVKLIFEPGRVIVGNAGVLVVQVLFVKDGISKRFCIIDGAMNDLIRPTLYNAYHKIKPLSKVASNAPNVIMDVVGPICESGDFIARDRKLPMFAEGDFLAIMTTGAYSAAMGSTYNSRPLAPEVLVDGDKYATIRRRLTVEDMLDLESLPSWLQREYSRNSENSIQ